MTDSLGADAGPVAGRTALVTGAGNGLGRAIAMELVASGARVVLTGRRREKLVAVAAELAEQGAAGAVRVATVDTASEESVVALAEELADEEISVLVNNAGVAGPVAPLTAIAADD